MKIKGFILFLILSFSKLYSQLPNRGCGTAIPSAQYDSLFQQKVIDYLNTTTAASRVQSTFQIPVIFHVIHGGQAIGTYPNINQGQLNSQIQVLNDDYGGTGFNTGNYPATAFQAYATNTAVAVASKDGLGRIGISNTGISFCLALKDSLGNVLPEPGIERMNWNSIAGATNPTLATTAGNLMTLMDNVIKPATIWSPNKYLNIWVTDANPSASILGYATFPPLSGLIGVVGGGTANTDGLWCWAKTCGSQNIFPSGTYSAPYNFGRTLTHEISHYLGIIHIWGDASCANDYCIDTPGQQAATYNTQTYPYLPNNCAVTIPPTGPNGVMFMNFCDYTDDAAMYMFTEDQKIRMQTAMTNSPYRNLLGTHGLCTAVISPTANFSLSSNTITVGQSVSVTDLSLPTGSITAWNYSSPGSVPSTSALQNPNFTFNTTGVFTISLTVNAFGLNSSISKTIAVTSCPTPTINANVTNNLCFGACNGSATITTAVTSGAPYTYSWSPVVSTNSVITNLCSGNYTCVVTNSCGVSNTKTLSISQPPAITITISSTNPTVCVGNSTILSASVSGGAGGYLFNWSNGSTVSNATVTPTILPTTIYTLTVNDLNGCVKTKTVAIGVNPIPIITSNHSPILPICADKTATINLTGALNYTTNPGNITSSNFTVSPPITTGYNITGISLQGCIGFTTDTIKVYVLPTVLSNVSSNTVCVGSILTFSNTGANTFTLFPTANTGSVISTFPTLAGTTNFTVAGTSPLGCINTKTITVNVISLPVVSVSPNNPSICAGQSVVLNANGATTYTWNTGFIGGAISLNPTLTTTYSVIGRNNAGCENSAITSVNVLPSPIVTINSPSTTVCFGYSMTLTANGASNYQWFNGATTNTVVILPLTNYTYSVVGNNGGACSDTAIFNTIVLPALTVSAIASTTMACVGQTINLNATGNAVSYAWNPGSLFGASQSVQINSPTTYTAIGQGSNGCLFFSTVFVDVQNSNNVFPFATPNTICIGDSSILSVNGGSIPVWSSNPVPNTQVVYPLVNTSYTYTAVDFIGCISTVTYNVVVDPSCNVTVYNGFSPNGDGINDFWVIDNIEKYPTNKVYIYNRWGNKMFETVNYNNTNNYWDGKYNGRSMTSGTYFYIIETEEKKYLKKVG